MENVIAIVWDFDKTLVKGYMQDPIFEDYNIEPKPFWQEVNSMPERYREQNILINPNTAYLNIFLRYAKAGIFHGLNNARLSTYGPRQTFYEGIPEIFTTTKSLLEDDPMCQEYHIRVEHYIVSTGFRKIIQHSSIAQYVEYIWGCELIDGPDGQGGTIISEVGYTIDNTSKTRSLFEINKGVHKRSDAQVNTKMTEMQKRVDFRNMIYIADGPSDIPAFSVVKGRGGATFAIYPRGDAQALSQVERLRMDDRIDMFAEADYRNGSMASMWICEKIKEMAYRIKQEEKFRRDSFRQVPQHLI